MRIFNSIHSITQNRFRFLSIIFLSALAGTMFASINDVVSSSEAASLGIRFEGRDGYAGALARGVVSIGEPSGASVTSWDSTAFADGWQSVSVGTNTAELAVLNNAAIAIEGGRLQSNTTWDASVTHLLRNVVYVPNGVTLTISEGTVVKFCEGTYIKVEDGGKLNVVGAASKDVIFTAANDNSVGQQIIGIGEEKLSFAGIKLQSSAATFTDNNYFQGRGFSFNLFPIVTLNNTTAFAAGGVARIPVTLSGATRDAPFFINWVAETNGVSFASGSLNWTKSSDGTKNIVVNFDETFAEAVDSFTIRIVTNTACSISKETCLVTISEWITLPIESNENQSSSIRFDGRNGYAGALSRGVVSIGESDGASVTSWDSTAFADGWQSVSVGTNTTELAVLNNAAIAIEGGRLQLNTTWDASVTHLLRNVVYVPNGVTLTVSEGTVVKFCEGTYIKVEDGGKLNVVGADGKDVIFTAANDNSAGKPIVGIGEEKLSFAGIKLQSSAATFTDNGYFQGRGFIFSPFPTVTLNDAIAFRASGNALIPVTVAGATRNTPFSIDWVAKNGSAKFGEDYTIASGTITWSKSSEGTKTIQIPLVVDHIVGSNTTFTLSVTTNRCVSVAKESCTVEIRELDMLKIDIGDSESRTIRFDGRDSYAGALARGVVSIGEPSGASVTSWDSTAFADGWQSVSVGTNTAELAVLNNAAITIEGGRLHSNTTWDSSVTHLLRNIVYVPNGVTLTISEGTVVKFCEGTYIKVEDGGKLNVVGADGKDVIFTAANDNSVGKPIVSVGEEKLSFAGIKLQSSAATFTDNGWVQARGFSFGSYPTVTLHDAIANRLNGKIYVAATISGATRNQSFSIEWEAEADTAKFKEDYTLASGRINWSKSGDGTKWIEIPLNTATVANERRQFKVLIKIARGVNVGDGEAVAQIDEYENCSFNGDEITTITSEYSDGAEIDDDSWRQPIFLNEIENVRYSGLWQNKLPANQTLVRLSVESNNGITTLAEYPGEEIGEYKLNVASFDQGYYKLKHEIIDESTGNVVGFMQRNFSIVDKENVVLHGGLLTGNEVWEVGKVHVVYQTVVVPSVYTLFIEPGAIVKFMSGTGIDISSGGAFFANNIIFTHINDDTIGGDTLSDGFTVPPTMDSYTLAPIGSFTFGPGSELRYITQPVDLTGTISGNKILLGGSTYRVSGTLTIANGGNLIIPAGTVLKMKSGASIVVNNGGSLNAQGTRVAPIVITSINDDEFGGDTNGDGDRSIPQPGDWDRIGVSGGTANFEYTHILYSSKNSTTGAINMRGGVVVFNYSEIAHGLYDAVGVESGNFYMTNSIIRDCLLAFRHWPKDPIVNSVIYDCGRLTQGGGQNFVNCIFSEITETWEAFGFSQNTTYKNCCFWNKNGSVLTAEGNQDALTVCGKNGNIWGDPKFVDPDNGDFRIREGSACIDAADSSIAPEEDYYGQPRITLRGAEEGGGLGEEALADIGICEVMPRNVTSDIDLVPNGIQTLTNAVVGQVLYITWEVANKGGKFLEASWRDTVSLVSSMGQEVVLGDKITSSQISVGGSVFCSAYFVIPAIEEGVWYPKVNVNSTLDVFEGALGVNNVLIGENPISVSVDTVDTDLTNSGVLGAGLQKVLKLSFTSEDKNRMVKFSMPDGVKVSYGFGFVPNSLYSSGVIVSKDGTAMFLVPEGDIDVYVVLESEETCNFIVSTDSVGIELSGVYPNTIPSSGSATLTIAGAGFGITNSVVLSNSSDSYRIESIKLDNNGNVIVPIDCSELLSGKTYSITVESDGKSATLDNALSVTGVEGKGEFWADLIIPSSTRQGRDSICYIEYGNKGTADIPAQILQVVINGDGSISSKKSNKRLKSIRFVACGNKPISGIIPPNSSYKIPFVLHAGSSNNISLRIEADGYDVASYWENMDEYISEISAAATVLGKRGGDPTNYTDVLELVMQRQTNNGDIAVHGVVIDQLSGKPIPNAIVSLNNVSETNTISIASDSNGNYIFPVRQYNEYSVSVLEYGISSVDFVVLDEADIEIDLYCNTKDVLHVYVVNGDDICSSEDLNVFVRNRETSVIYNGIDNGDFYAFKGLPNGTYEITASIGEKEGTLAVFIYEDILEPFECCVELLPTGSISGSVSGFANCDDVLVFAYGNGVEKSTILKEDGTYFLENIPIGEYWVSLFDLTLKEYTGETTIIVEENQTSFVDFVSTKNVNTVSSFTLIKTNTQRVNMLKASEDEVDIPWWRSVRSVAKEYYDDGLRLFGSVSRPKIPTGEYNCEHNMAKYNNDLAKYNAFNHSLKDFMAAYGQTDSMLFWAKLSKGISVSADAYGSYYSLVTSKASFGKNAYEKLISEIAKDAILDGMGMLQDGFLDNLNESNDIMDEILEILTGPISGSVNLIEYGERVDRLDTYVKQMSKSKKLYFKSSLFSKYSSGASLVFDFLDVVKGIKRTWDAGMQLGEELAKLSIGKEKIKKLMPKFKQDISNFENISSNFNNYELCCSSLSEEEISDDMICEFTPDVPKSLDPNEMVGPLGFGDPDTERFVVPGQWMTYTIYFENKSDATAAAQEVTVSNPLSEYLDWDTFEMIDVAFNNQIDMGLSGKSSGVSEVVMNGANTLVRTELTLDKINGKANWYLRIVDPTTSTGWPDDPVAGFLPPNDETHRGEGHLTYRIKVREDAKPNAKITNSASIVFDYNEPIETDPAWWNTIKWNLVDNGVIDISTSVPDSEANASGDFVYDGNPKKLNVVITKKNASGDTVLVEGVDYDCTYYDNINADSAKNNPRVTITAKGEYYGEKTIEFDIKPRPVTVTSDTKAWPYDGLEHKSENVTEEGFIDKQGLRYSNFASIVDVGSCENTFEYTYKRNTTPSNYDIKIEYGTLTINKSSFVDGNNQFAQNVLLLIEQTNLVYNGYSQELSAKLYIGSQGGITNKLEVGKDYTVSYDNNVDANRANYVPTMTITGINSYTGVLVTNFVINPRPVTLTSASNAWTYDGESHSDETVVAEGFVEGQGVSYSDFASIENIGTCSNTFKYTFNEGTRASNYAISVINGILTVNRALIADENGKLAPNLELITTSTNLVYNGESQQLDFVLMLNNNGVLETLNSEQDYVVTYTDNVDANRADYIPTLTITGVNGYEGSFITNFVISPRPITLTSANKSFAFDGNAHSYERVDVGGLGFVGEEGMIYSDFATIIDVGEVVNSFTYQPNNKTRLSNYAVSQIYGKLVVKSIGLDTMLDIEDDFATDGSSYYDSSFEYDGAMHTINTNLLFAIAQGTDVDLSFSFALEKNGKYQSAPFTYVDAGTYTFWYKISSANYVDYIHQATVTITKRPLTKNMIVMEGTSFEWTGLPVVPSFYLNDIVNGVDIIKNSDWNYTLSNNINHGTKALISVVASESGNYTGSFSQYFNIIPKIPTLEGTIGWRYNQGTGTFFAQLNLLCTDGNPDAVEDVWFYFEDRVTPTRRVQLWNTKAGQPIQDTMIFRGSTFRWQVVPSAAEAIRSSKLNTPFVAGVKDINTTSVVVPVAERMFELYAQENGKIMTKAQIEKFICYLAWSSSGKTNFMQIGASSVTSELVSHYSDAPRPVELVNNSLAFGVSLNAVRDYGVKFKDIAINPDGTLDMQMATFAGYEEGIPGPNATLKLLGTSDLSEPFTELGTVNVDSLGGFSFKDDAQQGFYKLILDFNPILE